MIQIRAFPALRPVPELAARIASVPYDVVDEEEARALADQEPLSFIRVVRAEVDLPVDSDPYAQRVYTAARDRLVAMQSEGQLLRESEPAIYLYRQQASVAGRRVSQTGVVACVQVDDYLTGRVKTHELTRPQKEDDRTRHVLATGAHTGPVFLLHPEDGDLSDRVMQDASVAALYDFEASDGVRHTVWRAPDPEPYVKAFARMPAVYVADGHHRAASAARAALERRRRRPRHDGSDEHDWFLAALFPAPSLSVLPYHRVVRDLGRHDPAGFLDALSGCGSLQSCARPRSDFAPGQVGVYLEGRWHRLEWPADAAEDDPVRRLDYTRLNERVLAPVLGIDDVRTDPRIDFVGGARGLGELERRVDTGRAAAAFAMAATSVDQLMAVADAGQIMPPKSTWFEPKLRSGLLIHTFD